MKSASKLATLCLLVIGLILVTVIAGLLPGQADFTADRLYTLSEGSKSLLGKIEDPISLQLYFSRSVKNVPIRLKNYASRVELLLRQYEGEADGKITLSMIDPKPDTEEEEAAIRAGISRQYLRGGESFFFGLAIVQIDQEEAIASFNLQREALVEYDTSRAIHRVQQYTLPTLGVLSSLPVISQFVPGMMPGQQMPQDWILIEELRNSFEVEQIQIDEDEIPDDIDLLVVIHPQNLSETILYALDQYVLSGKPAFMVVDPSSYIQKSQIGQQAMMSGMNLTSSDLPRLFESWEIEYDSFYFVADLQYASMVSTGIDSQPSRYPAWLSLDSLSSDSPVTAQLNSMLLVEAGDFELAEGSEHELTPLVVSSDRSDRLTASILTFSTPESLLRQINPTGQIRTLAGIVRGKFKTAFPNGKPIEETDPGDAEDNSDSDRPSIVLPEREKGLTESVGTSTVALVADTDFLADQFSVQRYPFFGLSAFSPINDNLSFVSNIAEFLTGSDDLISLRGKGTAVRPFRVVEELEMKAQQSYQDEYEELQAELDQVQEKLRELEKEQTERGRLVASQDVRDLIADYQREEADKRAALREIRKRLREDIESLEIRLALFNLLTVPILLVFIGIRFFVARSRRQVHRLQ